MNMQYFVLITCWGLYFFLHSFLASSNVKEYLKNSFGLSFRTQRLIYSTVSTLGLLAILFYNGALGGERLLSSSQVTRFISLFLAAAGVLIVRMAFRSYDLRSFLGLEDEKKGEFESSGILAHVRHPLYTATILIVIGFFLYDSRFASLVSLVCTFIYLPIGIYLEEKKLVKEFGDRYRAYRQKVPMLMPSIKKYSAKGK